MVVLTPNYTYQALSELSASAHLFPSTLAPHKTLSRCSSAFENCSSSHATISTGGTRPLGRPKQQLTEIDHLNPSRAWW
jgi:hypothetical protein